MSFLISSFPLLSYSVHHLTLSSSHYHSHLISSPHTSHHHSHCLLSSYSSIHSNHIPCLLSSSHLHHAHHLAYSSIIHPTSSSFQPPSIPSFSHFSLIHSSISPWCSSRFPQNSFSTISFIIPLYSLFHSPFLPISTPSPSSPLIPTFHSHSHLCSLFIHLHPFPSHSIPFHHYHSIPIPLLTSHSHTFSGCLPFIIPLSLSSHPFLLPFLLPFLYFPSSTSYSSHFYFASSFLIYEFYTMFVRILLIALSFGVLIGNTLCQLDVTAFASDV